MRARAAITALITGVALAGCLPAGRVPVKGRAVKTDVNGWAGRAELLAVTSDSIWVWKEGIGLVGVSKAGMVDLTVVKHRYGTGMTFRVLALTGVVSGVALTAACGRVEDASCGGVIPLWMLLTMAAAGIAAIPNHFTSQVSIPVNETERLRAYARYPQGLPNAVRVTMRP